MHKIMSEKSKQDLYINMIKEFEFIQLNKYQTRKSFFIYETEREYVLYIINIIKKYNINTLSIEIEDRNDRFFGKTTVINYRNTSYG